MKKIIYISILLLAYSCNDSNTKIENENVKLKNTLETKKDIKIEIDSLNSLILIKEFAESYLPNRLNGGELAILPTPSDSILIAFKNVNELDFKSYEKYLSLILIKLYSAHMECCNQSYEMRKQPPNKYSEERDPLLYNFLDLIGGYNDKSKNEFIPSSIAYEYIKKHSYLQEYKEIRKQVEIIKQVEERISNEYKEIINE